MMAILKTYLGLRGRGRGGGLGRATHVGGGDVVVGVLDFGSLGLE